jgi:hypothetical protein
MDFEYPDHYVCPITLDLMLEPVKASDNNIYDKAAIVDWYKINKISPLTREELSPEFIAQNKLKEEIINFINSFDIKVTPYSPKNITKSESSEDSESSEISESSESNNLITFNCTRCNESLLFSSHLGNTVCPSCNITFIMNNCLNCNTGHIIRSESTGHYRCRSCGAFNNLTNRPRKNSDCVIC